MFALSRWFQEWRKERQLLKETEAREVEKLIQRKKRDDQQAQALQLTLHELQRTMDPLIAAQVYNNRVCPLSRLPEELLVSSYKFDGSYRGTAGATIAGAGTTPIGMNTSPTAISSKSGARAIIELMQPSFTADSTAMLATVPTTFANFPPSTSIGGINRNDGV
ncbi:hypothetical protein N0V90_013533 [Kalmusia sp. IMI 367209]|nr:hypothetical protein N0V90_013533 [Kalmusia sp. IMI 367209]